MKIWFALALLCSALAPVSTVMAQPVASHFSGTATMIGFLNPGTVLCPSGQPTGLWPAGAPCSPGSRAHVRGMSFEQSLVADDARATGRLAVVMNANTDGWTVFGPGSGPMWGTVSLTTASGVWEGSWTGNRVASPDGVSARVDAVMHGTGGSIEGMQLVLHLTFAPPMAFDGGFTARIVAPAGR